jgi:hypothetical protein
MRVSVGMPAFADAVACSDALGPVNMIQATVVLSPVSRLWASAVSRARRGQWDLETVAARPMTVLSMDTDRAAGGGVVTRTTVLGPCIETLVCAETLRTTVLSLALVSGLTHDCDVPAVIDVDVTHVIVCETRPDFSPVTTPVRRCAVKDVHAFVSGSLLLRFVSSWEDATFQAAFANRSSSFVGAGRHELHVVRRLHTGEDLRAAAKDLLRALHTVLDCGCSRMPMVLPIILQSAVQHPHPSRCSSIVRRRLVLRRAPADAASTTVTIDAGRTITTVVRAGHGTTGKGARACVSGAACLIVDNTVA